MQVGEYPGDTHACKYPTNFFLILNLPTTWQPAVGFNLKYQICPQPPKLSIADRFLQADLSRFAGWKFCHPWLWDNLPVKNKLLKKKK